MFSSCAAFFIFLKLSGVVISFLYVINGLFKYFLICGTVQGAYTASKLSCPSVLPIITGTLGSIMIEWRLV